MTLKKNHFQVLNLSEVEELTEVDLQGILWAIMRCVWLRVIRPVEQRVRSVQCNEVHWTCSLSAVIRTDVSVTQCTGAAMHYYCNHQLDQWKSSLTGQSARFQLKNKAHQIEINFMLRMNK